MAERFRARSKIYREKMNINREGKIALDKRRKEKEGGEVMVLWLKRGGQGHAHDAHGNNMNDKTQHEMT